MFLSTIGPLRAALPVALSTMLLAAACAPRPSDDERGFVPLFDGRTLSGWVQRGGEAVYRVEDGAIVGRTVPDTPNSFLCTEKEFRNFILRLEVKVDPPLNSGIQIRSQSRPDHEDGRVHGYQVEIDPTPRGLSGRIYDEGRRRVFLDRPKPGEDTKAAFEAGQWNEYQIEAVGARILTWVNGAAVADLVDDTDRAGFIGLQVHAADQEGLEVRWRNIRIRELPEIDGGQHPNTLHDHERAEGWRLLWDGNTGWGWRGARGESFPATGWTIADGILTVAQGGGNEPGARNDIITVDRYSDFELTLDFKLTPGANSGVKYFVDPELEPGEGSAVGLEYQILDDASHPDARLGRGGRRTLASLYDVIAAPAEKPVRPLGEWNEARIISMGNRVEHWLNGEKMIEFQRGSPEFREAVAQSEYSVWKDFGELPEGHILLQEHGGGVSFRNIKLREFSPYE